MSQANEIKNASSVNLNCRMYENKYPEVESLVVVRVKSIAEMGAYVTLVEYNNVEGMIQLSELSRKRIRSVTKLIRVGRQEVCLVLRVDKEKGYIDLSKRRVTPEEISGCENRYNRARVVHGVLRHTAEVNGIDLEDLYEKIGWPLAREYPDSYAALKAAILNPEKVLGPLNIEPKLQESLIENIRRRLTPQPVKVRADIEVTCFHYEGIEAVRQALKMALDLPKPEGENDIKINLVAPPLYVVVTTSSEKTLAIERLTEAIAVIKKTIEEKKGSLVVKEAPRVVSAQDERDLTLTMEQLERQNREISGDDDFSDEEDD